MDINLSLSGIKQKLTHILGRYHVIIFVIIVFGGLAVAVFLLNGTVASSAKDSSYTPDLSSSFDQTTIKRIEALRTTDESSQPLDLSQGRTNPFVE